MLKTSLQHSDEKLFVKNINLVIIVQFLITFTSTKLQGSTQNISWMFIDIENPGESMSTEYT